MDAFTTHTGTAAPLRRTNVDTDQIIPAEYLKRITRTGFEDGLFVAWRTNEPDFVLNRPEYANASILVAGPDFGTGSSREHANWALLDGGFHSVDSSDMAFATATRMAMQEGLAKADPVLLEPMEAVTVSVPAEATPAAQRLLTGRRGQILGYDGKPGWDGWDVLNARIPESEIGDLIIELRSKMASTY